MLPSLSPDPVFVEEAERDTDVSTSIRAMSMLPEPRKQAALIRMDGVGAGTAMTLGVGTTRMGRDAGCELRIEDSAVSRVHAEIVRLDSTHVLVDLGAQNGVFVNGRQVSREALHDGDWIQLGPRVRFRYSVSDDNELKLLQRLYETSSRDALTGAYNRQHFGRLMATELSFAERHHTPLSLMLIDLDRFKQVNDRYGHGAGDIVLKQVTTALTQRLRDGDTLATLWRRGVRGLPAWHRSADLLAHGRTPARHGGHRARGLREPLHSGDDQHRLRLAVLRTREEPGKAAGRRRSSALCRQTRGPQSRGRSRLSRPRAERSTSSALPCLGPLPC